MSGDENLEKPHADSAAHQKAASGGPASNQAAPGQAAGDNSILNSRIRQQLHMVEVLERSGIIVVDVFPRWAGPCEVMNALFKRLRSELGGVELALLQAESDEINMFERYKNKSIPTFLIYRAMKGANGPLLEKVIKEQADHLRQDISPVPWNQDTVDVTLDSQESSQTDAELEVPLPVAKDGCQLTLALIKPDATKHEKEIKESLQRAQIEILREKCFVFTKQQARDFYHEHSTKSFFKNLVDFVTSGPVIAMVLEKEDCVEGWRQLLGPANPKRAKEEMPQSLRAMFGTDGLRNGLHGSESVTAAEREISFILSNEIQSVRKFQEEQPSISEKTLCIIQPELVNDYILPYSLPSFMRGTESLLNMVGTSSLALEEIGEKRPSTADATTSEATVEKILYMFRLHDLFIERMEQITVNKQQAGDLFGSDKEDCINNLSNGSSIVMVLSGSQAVKRAKDLVGPKVISEARETAPESLRAIYGLDDVRLGIHVAESAEAAHREIDLFFPYEDHHKSQGYLAFKEQTAAIIKPDAVQTGKVDALLAKIQEQGFNIQRRKEVQFTPEKVKEFYSEHLEKPFFNDLVAYMTSGPTVALILERQDAVAKWRELMGPTDSNKAREISPNSIRALFGTDLVQNAVYGSDTAVRAAMDIGFLFDDKPLYRAQSMLVRSKMDLATLDAKKAPSRANLLRSQTLAKTTSLGSKQGLNKPSSRTQTPVGGSKVQLNQRPMGSKAQLNGSKAQIAASATPTPEPKLDSAQKVDSTASKSNLASSGSKELSGSKSNMAKTASKPVVSETAPSPRSGSRAQISGSKGQLSGSKTQLGSKSQLASKVSGSKNQLNDTKTASAAKLSGSKNQLIEAKSLTKISSSKPQLSGSKAQLAKADSKGQLSGSKAQLAEKKGSSANLAKISSTQLANQTNTTDPKPAFEK